MPSSTLRQLILGTVLSVLLAVGHAEAHVVPNMVVEADFAADGAYTLRINMDPRTFLAADPTTLPPVPGSWYQEQTPEQIAATQEKARDYLSKALGLIFGGQKTPLPACDFQAIDGEDNAPLKPETQEVHLLATVKGQAPAGGGGFQIEFGREANTTLIYLPGIVGNKERRAQVLFPGETSRLFQPQFPAEKAAVPSPAPATAPNRLPFFVFLGVVIALLFQGWRLLRKYRHHHRGHRKPKSDQDVNN